MPLQIGQMLYGFCCGVFGRDSYDDKRIEAIGFDWIVVRGGDGIPEFACGETSLQILETDECTKPKPEEDF